MKFLCKTVSHLFFEPIARLEKLTAITPRPAINLVRYHGVLAPHARWRSQVVRDIRPAPDATARSLEASPPRLVPRARGPGPR